MRGILTVALAAALLLAACSSAEDVGAPAVSITAPVTTTTAGTTPVTTPTTTSTTPPTTTTEPTTTTTVTTTTTTTVPTIDIDGSPMIEFSIDIDEEPFDGQLTEAGFTTFVVETLRDERSWISRGVGFRLVDDGGLFTVTVATPARTDQLCWPLRTNGRYSCARNGWIVFNSDRWFGATDSWPADLETYRRYLVNHEIGHYILGAGHPRCPGPGQLAPIMMQQTKGLDGCEPNGWVDP
jgi:hypothetical protein